jgi:hypothetical protein
MLTCSNSHHFAGLRVLVVAPSLYEVALRRPVADLAANGDGSADGGYLTGDELLGGWRARSTSLIREHKTFLERTYLAADVERTRQYLQFRTEVPTRRRSARQLPKSGAAHKGSAVLLPLRFVVVALAGARVRIGHAAHRVGGPRAGARAASGTHPRQRGVAQA